MHPHHTSSWIKVTLIVVGSCVLNTWGQSKPLETPKAPCPQWTHSAPSQQERWEQLIIPYQQPAKPRSHYGTLIGNGLIGVEQSGDPGTDIFHLNHKGFWSGDPQYTEELHRHGEWTASPKDRRHAWEQTRKLLKEAYAEGLDVEQRLAKMKEMEEAAKGMWCTSVQATFLPMGDLSIRQPGHEANYTDYRRWLDLDGATAHVTYRYQGTVYRRQAFVSHPDRVMVVQLTNDGNVPMDMEIGLQLPPEMQGKSPDNQVTVDTKRKEVVMTGRAPIVKTGNGGQWVPDRGITFESRVRLLTKGGSIETGANSIRIVGATQVTLIYASETSYKDNLTAPATHTINLTERVKRTLDQASQKSIANLLERHQKDFRSLFRRLWLSLEGESIHSGNRTIAPEDYVRYYQYGRYLMISAERANTLDLPFNLCGLWNPVWDPPNQSAYFLNENLQKMHAVAGPGNLSDTCEPYWKWIKHAASSQRGGKTAKDCFGIDQAWTISHSSDAWCKTDLWGGETRWSNWNGGGYWIAADLYNAYDFTGDIDFLAGCYPVFEGASRFALGNMIQVDGIKGELKNYVVLAPSTSPEHWFLEPNGKYIGSVDIMTTGDLWACRNLFHITLRAGTTLQQHGYPVDTALLRSIRSAISKLPPLELYIDTETGLLREWYNEYRRGEDGHRHATHLMGFFFGYAGMPATNSPQAPSNRVFNAARHELKRLGDLGGGYHPDIVTMGIRAGMPEWALGKILDTTPEPWAAGSFIWKWIPISAPVVEPLLDSRHDTLDILPALPATWKNGRIAGIRARGGAQLSISWQDGELTRCAIDLPTQKIPRILYKGQPVNPQNDHRFIIRTSSTTTL